MSANGKDVRDLPDGLDVGGNPPDGEYRPRERGGLATGMDPDIAFDIGLHRCLLLGVEVVGAVPGSFAVEDVL
jgi:hypothetical protein